MKLQLWSIGKKHDVYVKTGIADFSKRMLKYYPVEWTILPVPKNAGMLSAMDLKNREAETVLQWLTKGDYLVALDERGEQLTSAGLAQLITARADAGTKNLVFLIGGAFGLGEAVLKKANLRWSLSQLTFPHQLVRLILAEQLYRACTIARNEKYHHP